MPPFLMHLVSDDDHWVYLGSNGAISAGRRNPEHALFPYYTQDKLFDMAGATGGLTLVRRADTQDEWWKPLDTATHQNNRQCRSLAKNTTGNKIQFDEVHQQLKLRWRCLWSVSKHFGLVRRMELVNESDSLLELELVDGMQNLMPSGVTDTFQNTFSILADAYKRSELLPSSRLGLYYLNSIPTDRAVPNESLLCTTVWSSGLEGGQIWISETQKDAFLMQGQSTMSEEVRGSRGAYLIHTKITLLPGEKKVWWFAADIDQTAGQVLELVEFLESQREPGESLQEEIDQSSLRIRELLAPADAVQMASSSLQNARHFSNTLYNVLRGGIFAHGVDIPVADFIKNLQYFNKAVAQRHKDWLEGLPAKVDIKTLLQETEDQRDPHLVRLTREYLPLVYSRRHGDPSRPWNRFSIELYEKNGELKYAYQGNWRDIFQNWEALLHSFPDFIESTIYRFVNASTADGYNPYRLTREGYDWETMDPDEPWSNIGYWGDHQIIYLLKLLELSHQYHPDLLSQLLDSRTFSYAQVPYRIKPFEQIFQNPRDTIEYSVADEEEIRHRVEAMGADGKLLPAPDFSVLLVTLTEKLLVPLLTKLANFIPHGGIWMNTQRPEWNDANNALAGYGLSVVTLGYIHRYIRFLEQLFCENTTAQLEISAEVYYWLEDQFSCIKSLSDGTAQSPSPEETCAIVCKLGLGAEKYRENIYQRGFTGETRSLETKDLLDYLLAAREVVADSLRHNRRADNLYHSYNILQISQNKLYIHNLDIMLEGQVSILSANLLNTHESTRLLETLRNSPLYEERQQSYLLYPDKTLPRFLEKNRIAQEDIADCIILKHDLAKENGRLVETDPKGSIRFKASLHNAEDVRACLAKLSDASAAKEPEAQIWDHTAREKVISIYEKTFNHQMFTGRSGSFFAYEGLGSIYWHMVSKLLLAVQENYFSALEQHASPKEVEKLAKSYHDIRKGIGLHKSPELYGAFTMDAYSHTPKNKGVQQPGMTGQVKEELLARRGELGLLVCNGRLHFNPALLPASEFSPHARAYQYFSLQKEWENLDLPANSLAFTCNQVPVIYQTGPDLVLEVQHSDGRITKSKSPSLTCEQSQMLFSRSRQIQKIILTIPAHTHESE